MAGTLWNLVGQSTFSNGQQCYNEHPTDWFSILFHLNEIQVPYCHQWIRAKSECEDIKDLMKQALELLNFSESKTPLNNCLSECLARKHGPCLIKLEMTLTRIEKLLEFIWEQFNIGHWKDVPTFWRELYCSISLIKIVLLSLQGITSVKELIRICDLSLLTCPSHDLKVAFGKLAGILNKYQRDQSCQIYPKLRELDSDLLNEGQDSTSVNQELGRTTLLQGNRVQIASEEHPTLEHFQSSFLSQACPVLLKGAMSTWPAMEKWSLEYILNTAGCRTVPVEIGSKYTSEDWTQKLMSIEEFIMKYMSNIPNKEIAYIAQHQLLDQIPELKQDIKIPEYCFASGTTHETDIDINSWFGPANTVTPTHYDPKHNLLSQVFGTKLVILFPPSESSHLYPFPEDSLLFNTSQVDLEDPSMCEKFPNVQKANFIPVLLSRGSMLYIPPKYWHFVRSLSPSFSVSFWFE